VNEEDGGEENVMLLLLAWPAAKEKKGGSFVIRMKRERGCCQMRVFSPSPLFILHFS